MATLTEEQRRFIVIQLAKFYTPTEVAEQVEERFGVEVYRQQVHHYNPTASNGDRILADRWKRIFRAARENYLSNVGDNPLAHERYRLDVLLRMLRNELNKVAPDPEIVMGLCAQAAKEQGGMFTNRQLLEHSGPGGGPIQYEELSDDELMERASQLHNRLTALSASENGDRSG